MKKAVDYMKKGNMRLSDSQKKAVYHREGPCLVLGTKGSKTTVITRRIGFLTDGITGSDWLLSVTFTRAAGREMAVGMQGFILAEICRTLARCTVCATG